MANQLYYGDNLDVLRRHVGTETIDLVYLDPPFNSAKNYNAFFDAQDGSRSAAQIQAFEDTWEWNQAAVAAYKELVEAGGSTAQAMEGFRTFLGETDMLAYLSMMAPRLIELRRVLKPTGSIYLHCDTAASAYLRMLMDAVFGPAQFRNEILWHYYNKMHDSRKKLFPRATDTLLFYVKDGGADFTYHQLKTPLPEPERRLKREKRNGKLVNVKDEDGHVVYYEITEKTMDNVWRIPMLQPASRERLGYPTQKPLALLERVIEASSNPGDLVLDPFCGCGTAIDAAQKLSREWIGIDVTHLAVNLMKVRMKDRYGDDAVFEVHGEPTDTAGAAQLASQDPYGFQLWSLGLVGARPAEVKKGADKGIDGRLFFFDGDADKRAKQVVISVKGGKMQAQYVRDLRGVLEREGAVAGVLIAAKPFTQRMKAEAASAGTWKSEWTGAEYPRMQLLTVEELLAGGTIDYPHITGADRTFRQAPAEPAAETDPHPTLFDDDA